MERALCGGVWGPLEQGPAGSVGTGSQPQGVGRDGQAQQRRRVSQPRHQGHGLDRSRSIGAAAGDEAAAGGPAKGEDPAGGRPAIRPSTGRSEPAEAQRQATVSWKSNDRILRLVRHCRQAWGDVPIRCSRAPLSLPFALPSCLATAVLA